MKALTFLLLVAALVVPVSGAVITFDDIINTVSSAPIPDGYAGFNWQDFSVSHRLSSPGPGYQNGVVSGDYAAYNLWARVATISNNSFDFNGAYLTGAWNNGLNVEVKGFSGGVEQYSQTVVVNTNAAQWFDFNFYGIDSLTFRSYGGTYAGVGNGIGTHFVLDNFTYNEAITIIPAPGAILLACIGTTMVGWLRHRCAL